MGNSYVELRASTRECKCSAYIPFLTKSGAGVSKKQTTLEKNNTGSFVPFTMISGFSKVRPL